MSLSHEGRGSQAPWQGYRIHLSEWGTNYFDSAEQGFPFSGWNTPVILVSHKQSCGEAMSQCCHRSEPNRPILDLIRLNSWSLRFDPTWPLNHIESIDLKCNVHLYHSDTQNLFVLYITFSIRGERVQCQIEKGTGHTITHCIKLSGKRSDRKLFNTTYCLSSKVVVILEIINSNRTSLTLSI